MQCFVCSEQLVGDSQYIEHHINTCLDRQGSSSQPIVAQFTAPASHDTSRHDPFTASSRLSPSSHASPDDADHALALALTQMEDGAAGPGWDGNGLMGGSLRGESSGTNHDDAFEHDRLLALALAREEEGLLFGSTTPAGGASHVCPSCGSLWADYDLSFPRDASFSRRGQITERRKKHLAKCEGRKERYMSWSPPAGGEEHGTADLDDDAMAEETGRSLAGGKGKRPRYGPFWAAAKDTVTGTAGMIGLLHHALSASHASPHGRTGEAYLACDLTEHIATKLGDYGWGCGYKNAQMVFSAFRHLPQYASPPSPSAQLPTPIPPIRTWQATIEQAWKEGYDVSGAEHFGGKLIGSRKWIGTTEVYTALTYMGVNAVIVDFPKPEPGSGVVTNKALVKWVRDYFRSPAVAPSAQPAPTNAFALLTASHGTSIHLTGKQPLYLQHKGHSRTIVGVEVGKSASGGNVGGKGRTGSEVEEVWLLVFDPGRPFPDDIKTAAASFKPAPPTETATSSTTADYASVSSGSSAVPPFKKLKPSRGGFGLTSSPKKQKGDSGASMPKFSDVLKCVRVNTNDLKKKDEYQILYVSATEPPLDAHQKQVRKCVEADVGVSQNAPAKKQGGKRAA